ncbi:alpha-L-fucosidase [Plantibacter sp. LMC-P-059a]|uniref:alpha-L-fucosidase n=1 Tax=Plantibacter sp. LMC-P-059a TaxID=3040297 RepID=UPI00254FC793|nr:alpha-L-fucosidase [Plantibacter sp. LMC-P-059a]
MSRAEADGSAAPVVDATARLAEAVAVVPSPRQLAWQGMEFYGFIHFGVNTMTDREWGDGTESPAVFDPSGVDAEQWVAAAKSAGMRGLILTCKHHDGFALWPTAVSDHSVASSPWRDGGGDLVAEVADACRAAGLAFGVYLSPWDRAEPSYGSGDAYDDFFVAQLTELLTGYGELFSVWFDGANGEGPNGKKQLYDWDRYYAVVRELQPNAAISVCGPDVRWCGNEAGSTRADEWSVVPASLRDAERTADRSQQVDDGLFSRAVQSDEEDLGSRAAILATTEPLVWYPAEVNTSIRPGWFHHPAEDGMVRSAEELFDIYERSVGGNATFLLNLPPTRDGVIAEPDLESLAGLGRLIDDLERNDVAGSALLTMSSAPVPTTSITGTGSQLDVVTWRPDDDDPLPTLRFRWDRPQPVSGVSVREAIAHGQVVEGVEVSALDTDGVPRVLASAATVGAQRILRFDAVETTELRVTITASRAQPHLARISVFTAS